MRITRWILFILAFPIWGAGQIENLIFAPPDSSFEDANPVNHYDTQLLTPYDSVFLSFDYFDQKFIRHKVHPGQTLFSLSRYYGLSIDELYFFNPGLQGETVAPEQLINIPMPNRAIIRYRPQFYDSSRYVPLYYIVKKGDTMYNICKRQFRMPIDTIIQRNNLGEQGLTLGQPLHVGWMNISGIPESFHDAKLDPISRLNGNLRASFISNVNIENIQEQKGAAVWKKDSKENADFYALHREAPINSVIEVLNPMTGRAVYVKVIGKIPDRAYDDEVIVVLSPLSAKTLGAKDPRFFVQIRYDK